MQKHILILHEQAQGTLDIGVQLLLGDARFLEIQDVVEAVGVQLAHDFNHRPPCAPGKRHRQRDQARDPFRFEQRQVPGHDRAPVMADHDHLRMAKMVHGLLDIATQRQQIIIGDLGRRT